MGAKVRMIVVLFDTDGFTHYLLTHKDAVAEAEGVSP